MIFPSKSATSTGGNAVNPSKKSVWTAVLCGIWLIAIVTGMSAMMLHENTPGRSAALVAQWPKDAAMTPALDAAYTVVMLAHPRCPCTRASLHELARLNAQTQGAARIYVFFTLPKDADKDWRQAPNWKLASDIPGAYVSSDVEGQQAMVFGAKTSGQVFIYDRAGALRFSGGLTGSRGQEGDNPAFDVALRLIRDGVDSPSALPVFGCPLREEASNPPSPAASGDLKG